MILGENNKTELFELIERKKAILTVMRRRKFKDLASVQLFARTYFSHYFKNTTPEFHNEIYKMLEEPRLGIAAPRGFAKSTIVQTIYAIWLLLNQENVDILTISNSQDLAQEWIRKIKAELTNNEEILNDYSDFSWGENKSIKWTESHLSIERGGKTISQIRAKGRGCQVRGFRPTHILCDDLEDDELVRSEDRRKELKQWFLGALLRTIKEEQQLIVIGTILHPLALLNDIIEQKDYFDNWKTKKFRALENDKSIWEDRFPTEWLLKERTKDTYSFQAEYQNDPLAGTEQLFKKEWLDEARNSYPQVIPSLKLIVIGIDPAVSTKEHADNSVFCSMGLGVDGQVYELDTTAGKWGTWDFINKFWEVYKRISTQWQGVLTKVVIETIAFQQVYERLLRDEAQRKSIFLSIAPVDLGTKEDKRPKDKFSRALAITHFFEMSRVRIKTLELYEELLLFPSGSHDDRVDAMVYALDKISRTSGEVSVFKSKEVRPIQENQFMQPRDIEEWQRQQQFDKDWRING